MKQVSKASVNLGRTTDNKVVVAIGEKGYVEWNGDCDNLDLLSKTAKNLVTNTKKQGKIVNSILLTGLPVIINEIVEYCDAIITAWWLGTKGAGVAEMLCGDYEFSGKQYFSWQRNSKPVNYGNSSYDHLHAYGYGYGLKPQEY